MSLCLFVFFPTGLFPRHTQNQGPSPSLCGCSRVFSARQQILYMVSAWLGQEGCSWFALNLFAIAWWPAGGVSTPVPGIHRHVVGRIVWGCGLGQNWGAKTQCHRQRMSNLTHMQEEGGHAWVSYQDSLSSNPNWTESGSPWFQTPRS